MFVWIQGKHILDVLITLKVNKITFFTVISDFIAAVTFARNVLIMRPGGVLGGRGCFDFCDLSTYCMHRKATIH